MFKGSVCSHIAHAHTKENAHTKEMATKSEVIVLDVLDVLHKNETKGADMIDIIMDIMREMHEYLAPR